MWKHEALLAFFDRLVRDPEFREWYAAEPTEALASYGLNGRELRDLEGVILGERSRPEVAAALRPLVQALVEVAEARAGSGWRDVSGYPRDGTTTYRRLSAEVELVRARLNEVRVLRQQRRPWWKFWE